MPGGWRCRNDGEILIDQATYGRNCNAPSGNVTDVVAFACQGTDTLRKLKAGSTVTVRVNGDGNRSWSLAGSTAAILKVEECVNNGGEKPARSSSTTAPQQDPPLVTNCRSITQGDYRCMVKYLDSAPGYVETVQISPAFNDAPRYFFKIRTGAQTADVWVGFGQEKWQFVGVWNLSDDGVQRCAEPAANQSPQARQALGQDAWQLCLN